jgi:hypothetical protein
VKFLVINIIYEFIYINPNTAQVVVIFKATDKRKIEMIKAPELDWDEIDAARVRARKLHSEAGYKIGISIVKGGKRLFGAFHTALFDQTAVSRPLIVQRLFKRAKENSPLERGLQAGWY